MQQTAIGLSDVLSLFAACFMVFVFWDIRRINRAIEADNRKTSDALKTAVASYEHHSSVRSNRAETMSND